jgi:DNA-binding transcriptional regulator YiaG
MTVRSTDCTPGRVVTQRPKARDTSSGIESSDDPRSGARVDLRGRGQAASLRLLSRLDRRCPECGDVASPHRHTQRTKVGRYTVVDASQFVLACANQHVELDLERLAEYRRRASVVVLAEAEIVGGEEIRVARHAIGLTRTQLSDLLGVEPQTLKRWETNLEPIGRLARLALLAVVKDPDALDRLDHGAARADETLHVPLRAAWTYVRLTPDDER